MYRIAIALILGWSTMAFASGYTITQVTDNDYNDESVQISGQNLAWRAEASSVYDIFFHDGTNTTNISNHAASNDDKLQIQDNQVVWYGGVEDENVYFFDGTTTTAITTSEINRIPQIDGSNIIWQYGTPAPNQEVFWYDGSGTTNITSDSIPDRRPDISGDYIVWDSYRNDNWQIMAYNVSSDTFTQITTSDWSNNRPKIDGTDLIWYGDAGSGWNIYYKKLGSSDAIKTISPLSTQNQFFEICDGYAVWTGWDGTDFEIYLYSVADDTTQVISDNSAEDTYPQTDGKTIVWYGWDGNDYEIYIYDILERTIEQITDNNYDDLRPYVSEGTVAWYGWDGADYEIFTAQETVPIPEPASLLLMLSGLLSVVIKRKFR